MVHSAGVRVTCGVIFRGYILISMVVVVDLENLQAGEFIAHLNFCSGRSNKLQKLKKLI
jgi:hypothetical protein